MCSRPACMRICTYLRSMIESSRQWAMARGLLEKNPVHGEEEWRIPLKRRFSSSSITGTEVQQKSTFEMQDLTLTEIVDASCFNYACIYVDIMSFIAGFLRFHLRPCCQSWPASETLQHYRFTNGNVHMFRHVSMLELWLRLREGGGDDAQKLAASSQLSAASAKEKSLPVLQANQDPFSSLFANMVGFWLAWPCI